jgi:subtilase family serine protease
MRSSFVFSPVLVATIVLATVCSVPLRAQDSAPESAAATAAGSPLITQPVDEGQLTTLKGNTHPLARPQFDLGTAPASLPMQRMLLVLKRSPEQETALRKLLDNQQDKKSPNYHKWLTPEQFGRQFGPSDDDMQTITSWLQSHGFQVGSTKGRTVLEFSGSASQVQEAFHTAIHKYIVNGEQHWANASDPRIPTALTTAVAGVKTLHDFISKPLNHLVKEPALAQIVPGKKPQVTFPPQNGQPAINALSPQDYAVIYNINPVYNNGYTGFPRTIGVVGRSNLFNSGEDVSGFLSLFGLSNPSFRIVLNGPDPGDLGGGEEAEATLDSTWSNAIAYNATVYLVVSASTNTTDGVDLSELYIVENNLADIMTESFSSCEFFATDAQLTGTSALAEQAAAQGITYFVSTGDSGAMGCDDPSNPPATGPVSVNLLASTPFNVAVGGTMFHEGGNASKYWTSSQPISETAVSYIPEDVWNESSLTNGLWSGSGGASAGNIQSGGTTPGVPKPSWQFGVTGIPNDGVRDLPDVSLTAASHDPYLLCLEGSCVPDSQGQFFIYFVSGTSASAPSFAGIMALIENQMASINPGQNPRQGQANYVLYPLAATQNTNPSQCNGSNTSAPPASTCIFNDVTVGNNVVPGEIGNDYQAGVGFDLTTGLGSVNVANLAAKWNTVTFNPTSTTLTLDGVTNGNTTPLTIAHGTAVTIGITVTASGGPGTPTGDVSLIAGLGPNLSISGQTAVGAFTLGAGGTFSGVTSQLPGGFISSVPTMQAS